MFARKQFSAVLLFLALPVACILATLHPHTAAAQDQPGASVTSLTRVREAVVRIVSVGAAWPYDAVEPSVEVGAGSGFIVDPEGIVVTNAHVVNGGNLFEVYLYGESEPRNAVVLGISECDDLAVLDIRGSGFPYLLWQETPVADSQVVYAAGYPDGKYKETKGRLQDAEQGADSDWASVDQAVRHTAKLQPGNSGGPLLNRTGRVVGVNYAGNDTEDSFLAIAKDLAVPLVEQLATGQNVDSIGINGVAFEESDDWFGIWVVAVKSGSPADQAGLQPGDIIYRMEGIRLADGGSMRDYCDILRSHRAGDTIGFNVLRAGEYYAGQLNGRPMVVRDEEGSAAQAATGAGETAAALSAVADAATATGAAQATAPPAGYKLVQDDTGVIQLFVPATWSEGASAKVVLGSAVYGPAFIIAEDPTTADIFAAPVAAVRVWFMGEAALDDELDHLRRDDACTFSQRVDVRTADLAGRADLWRACSGHDDWTAVTAALRPLSDEMTTVDVTVTRLEQLSSLETLVAPLGASLRERPIYWDIPSATIRADVLNIRSGSGTDYDKRGQLALGDRVSVLGKESPACEWYYVLADGVEGWISADPEHSMLDRDCAELKVVTEEGLQEFSIE